MPIRFYMALCFTMWLTSSSLSLADENKNETTDAVVSKAMLEINQFCDELERFSDESKQSRLFGFYQQNSQDSGEWREFENSVTLEKVSDEEHVFEVAESWSREDGAIALTLQLSSASGDWVHLIRYCYRQDGSLARSASTFNTFHASYADLEKEAHGASRIRDRYFDGKGAQIIYSQQVLDLQTKQPAPDLQFMDDEEPIFKFTSCLPFADLLHKK